MSACVSVNQCRVSDRLSACVVSVSECVGAYMSVAFECMCECDRECECMGECYCSA